MLERRLLDELLDRSDYREDDALLFIKGYQLVGGVPAMARLIISGLSAKSRTASMFDFRQGQMLIGTTRRPSWVG